MVVLEGPDGAGKSTLYQALLARHIKLRRYDVLAHLRNQNPGKKEQELRNLFPTINLKAMVMGAIERDTMPNIVNAGRPYIYDRLWLSELVYGPIVRGQSKFTDGERDMMASLLIGLDALFIVCLPPRDVVKQNVAETPREQMGGVSENIAAIYAEYDDLAGYYADQGMNVFLFDYTHNKIDELDTLVQTNIAKHKERSPWL